MAAGQTVALVGPSGTGKTTLAGLLARLYDPTGGRVLIDGIDIRECDLRSVRERIAVVPQDPILLSGSVAENILYGRANATREDMFRAAREAGCDFIANLPEGFDTILGDAGRGLSGGQRQRLTIARAFLKDAPLLILADPMAGLDAVSAELVLDAVRRLRNGRTTFVIAHRLSTVQDADLIVVLDAGEMVAHGTHETLSSMSALYRRLCLEFTATAEPIAVAEAPRPQTA